MTNSDIADLFKLFADLSELHSGNPFKIKQFTNAFFRIDKMLIPLENLSIPELEKIEGIGKGIAAKIDEINKTESFAELNDLLASTPEGVLMMMKIKGIGPKKIAIIWKELEIDEIGELLYACKENRLAQAKGFGLKTQQSVINQIEFMYASANKFRYAKVEQNAFDLVKKLQSIKMIQNVSLCGAIRRKMEVIDAIEILVASNDMNEIENILIDSNLFTETEKDETIFKAKYEQIPVIISTCKNEDFVWQLFEKTANEKHLELLDLKAINKQANNEEEIYRSIQLPYIFPEMREGTNEVELVKQNNLPTLIEYTDLKGALHNHSTWSDGLNTIAEMAKACEKLGYNYFGIADHSKAAFYAKGLTEEQIINQHTEIDKLNKSNPNFTIFKGIECDILYNGQMDYANDVLASFDYVVASVHSILKMNEEKAMSRLISAIENPYTTILGHPTGRLLLLREGYPINHKKIIDACAANKVAIEINANPYRLDLDWRYIDYALNKGVMLCINPDAHNLEGLKDMYFGLQIARKGGLSKENCLNAFTTENLKKYFNQKNNISI
ncbi:MAG: PHP domain-containing protein [Bacteroidia bacterium]